MTSAIPQLQLNSGHSIPQLGFGVFKVDPAQTQRIVADALEIGYRHIDTASYYQNEEGVGAAIAAASIPREQLFITTKLWNTDQGEETPFQAFETSLEKLGLDYVDLYLIHWPGQNPERYLASWKALEKIQESGRARSIGVSNFRTSDLDYLAKNSGTVPAVNQIELHPLLQQTELREYHQSHGILTEAWGPLGQGKYDLDQLPKLDEIAQRHGKSVQQVVIRWHLQIGNIVFPKSNSRDRIAQNFQVLDFELSPEELQTIAGYNQEKRVGSHPDDVDW